MVVKENPDSKKKKKKAPELLEWPNETSWVLKSTRNFLPQSTVSRRSDLSAEAYSSCWNKSVDCCLITLREEGSIRSIKFKDILTWNIFLMIKKISSINRKSHKLLYDEKGHPFLKLKESRLTKTTTWFANGQNVTVEQILGSEDISVISPE